MKIIKSLEKKINGAPDSLRMLKIKYSEKNAIKKKKKFYYNVEWTKEQSELFNDFWSKNVGKKIDDRWHKLYQGINGVFDYKYFPEYYYSVIIEPRLNPSEYCKVFSDKGLIPLIYTNGVDGLKSPKIFFECCNGVFLNSEHNILTRHEAESLLQNFGKCVIKPTVGTGSGHGVFVADFKNGIDVNSQKSISEIFDLSKPDFCVQEIIKNSDMISAICPVSLNTMRVITYFVKDEIHCAPLVLRVGLGEKPVDNIHAGGLCVGINKDGTLKKKAYQLGYGDNNVIYTEHPYSGVKFDNYYIGDVERIVALAIKIHKRIPRLGIVSWDFTFDEDNNAVLIEANCQGQSVWFPQIVNECSFFGDDTEYFCKMLLN